MESHFPRFLLYVLLIIGSWLVSCLLHFQFIHFTLFFSGGSRSSRRGHGRAPLVFPVADDPPSAVDLQQDSPPLRQMSSSSSKSAKCEGRYVYMLDVPARFDVLSQCVDGSPAYEDEYSVCVLMSNAGLGPALDPAADGIIPKTGWYKTDQYALEVIVHNRMRRYECLTDDPAAATAVYVPYYPALELQQHLCGYNTTQQDAPSTDFLNWLSSQPHWSAFGGRDHFIIAAKTTWMFRQSHDDERKKTKKKRCGNSFLHHPESINMTVLTYESNIWATPRRDLAVPYPSYFHPTSFAEVVAWQDRARASHRPWLFAFAGARRQPGTLPIRDRIIESCTTSCGIVDCSNGLQGSIACRTPRKLVSLFAASRFCLQPRGDSFMRRSSIDAVMAGCIPVFFHDASTFNKQYLWHDHDERRRYSVLIDADELMEGKVDIEQVLSRFSDEEVAAMREEVIKMIPRFLYKDPRVRFEGEMKDAFDIAIDGVMERIKKIKNREDPDHDGDVLAGKNS